MIEEEIIKNDETSLEQARLFAETLGLEVSEVTIGGVRTLIMSTKDPHYPPIPPNEQKK